MSHKIKPTLLEWRFLCSHFTLFTLCNLQPLALLYALWRTHTFFLPLGLEYPLPDFLYSIFLIIQVLTHMLPPLKKTWQPYLNSLFLLSTTYCFIPLLGTITPFHSINTILNYAVWLFFPIFPLPTHLCLSWIEAIWEQESCLSCSQYPTKTQKVPDTEWTLHAHSLNKDNFRIAFKVYYYWIKYIFRYIFGCLPPLWMWPQASLGQWG